MERSLGAAMKRTFLLALLLSAAAQAQTIDIRIPKMPPRGASGAPGAQPPMGASPGHDAAPGQGGVTGAANPPGHGGPGHATPGYGSPGYGTAGHGSPGYGAAGPAPAPGGSIASPMQQRRSSAYAPSAGYAAAAPAAPLIATPSAAPGNCRVQPSPDRQSLSLLGADGLPRRHVPLGEFRVQRVVHSGDGAWAVAITKLRGENQFAAMTLDLAKCETANTVDLPAAGEDVRFEAEAAVVKLGKGERHVPLQSGLVR